tara:strand:+ start:39119 stop:39859 length:741 start_codon:yes stop_codon:yes gene_type:complete
MEIKGFQPTSLIDYPGKICSVIFIYGCNFRCGYCHNKELVLKYVHDTNNKQNNNNHKLSTIPQQQILNHLEKRKHLVDAVTITGGEPTLYKELIELIQKIKQLGYLVKLDTNGSNPELLKELIDKNLVDYIAMDVKAPFSKYKDIVNVDIDINKIIKSIALIKNSNIDHEFRTTIVPSLLSKQDVVDIAKSLSSGEKTNNTKLILQQFTKQTELLNKNFNNQPTYSDEELEDIRKECEKFVKTVIR